MSSTILLCCDLDRTIIPNGADEESADARPLFRWLARRPDVTLAYVSGRHEALVRQGLREYALPEPDFAICDVGTTLYRVVDGQWRNWRAWRDEIAPDWRGLAREDLARLLDDVSELVPQERERQGDYKLSYYVPEIPADAAPLLGKVSARLGSNGVRASLVWSVDDLKRVGLLDVLPESANKLHAVRFLMAAAGIAGERTVFAGDSGNDLDVLASELQGVLVKNATEAVRLEALTRARAAGQQQRLYVAEGGFMGMNGNYAAGVLEGLAHFIPEVRGWLETERQKP